MCPWSFSGERGRSEIVDSHGVGSTDEALICERGKITRGARALIEHLNRDAAGCCLTESNACADHALVEHGTKARVEGEEHVTREASPPVKERPEHPHLKARVSASANLLKDRERLDRPLQSESAGLDDQNRSVTCPQSVSRQDSVCTRRAIEQDLVILPLESTEGVGQRLLRPETVLCSLLELAERERRRDQINSTRDSYHGF
jgi:hypothetical protein